MSSSNMAAVILPTGRALVQLVFQFVLILAHSVAFVGDESGRPADPPFPYVEGRPGNMYGQEAHATRAIGGRRVRRIVRVLRALHGDVDADPGRDFEKRASVNAILDPIHHALIERIRRGRWVRTFLKMYAIEENNPQSLQITLCAFFSVDHILIALLTLAATWPTSGSLADCSSDFRRGGAGAQRPNAAVYLYSLLAGRLPINFNGELPSPALNAYLSLLPGGVGDRIRAALANYRQKMCAIRALYAGESVVEDLRTLQVCLSCSASRVLLAPCHCDCLSRSNLTLFCHLLFLLAHTALAGIVIDRIVHGSVIFTARRAACNFCRVGLEPADH
jgi:hypothetical protein